VSNLLDEKKDLLAMLTHNLRSPNINIQQAIQLTKEENDPAIADRLHSSIEHSAAKQLVLIEAVTSQWRHESNGVQFYDLQQVELSSVLSGVLRQHDATLARKSLVVQNDVPKGLYARTEPSLIAKDFSNVLFNAIKFSRPGVKSASGVWIGTTASRSLSGTRGWGLSKSTPMPCFSGSPLPQEGNRWRGHDWVRVILLRKTLQKEGGSIAARSPWEGLGAVFTVELRATGA
jgi:K+-sensing histidine kinase KdpD